MKQLVSLFIGFITSFIFPDYIFSQPRDTTVQLKVSGLCEMCKNRIEQAAKVKGVQSAEWNEHTKMLLLTYNPAKVKQEKIHNKIAASGHDTEVKTAGDADYQALPACCKYRDMKSMDEMFSHQPSTSPVANDSAGKTSIPVTSQLVKGVVLEEDNKGSFKPLAGATVVWLGSSNATLTDENGVFSIPVQGERLVISYAGFQSDTLSVVPTQALKIILATKKHLNEVKVFANRGNTYINSYDPFRRTIITENELYKAACCNLSESFETNPSVDVSYNDAVTGSRQIQLLGLAGVYSQLTVENLPGPRGLATAQGLNSIPGTWLESIQLIKGTGSVVNGYESIAGQINVELKKPVTAEKLYANVYVNDFGKADLNLNLSKKVGKKWSTALLLHDALLKNGKLDFNKDGFRDLPTGNLFTAMNRWMYDNGKGVVSQFGIKLLNDRKTGGETDYNASHDKFTTNNYGLEINSSRIEGFGKVGYVFPGKKYKIIG